MGLLKKMDVLGLFETPDPKATIVDPLYGQKLGAANYLSGLLKQKAPLQQYPDLTDIQTQARELQKRYMSSGMPAGYGASYDYLNKIMGQPGDITQLPEYGAILKSVGGETDEAVNRAMQRFQLSGMSGSTPQGRGIGREIAYGGQKMLAQLAPFAESERNRQMAAVQQLMQLMGMGEGFQQSRMAAGQYDPLAALQQARYGAQYQQQMFPWTAQAPVASNLMGQGVEYTVQQDPSIIEQLAPLIQSGMMAFAMSDKRAKENVTDLNNAVDRIQKVHAKIYNYIGTNPKDRRVGVMAQDIEAVLPEAVKEIGGILYVDYGAVTSLATQAVNELIEEVQKLKRKRVA